MGKTLKSDIRFLCALFKCCFRKKRKRGNKKKEKGKMKPQNLLIYYGWPSGFNQYWQNQLVANEWSKYDLIVLGTGLEKTSHGDHANTSDIIGKVRAVNPCVKIFGYCTINQAFNPFKNQLKDWKDNLGVDGIFCDESGFDYGSVNTNGREAFNDKIAEIHSNSLTAFVNAWNQDHILSENNDPSYPQNVWNPNGVESALGIGDWSLLESFALHGPTATIEPIAGWSARCDKVAGFHDKIQYASCSQIPDDATNGQQLFEFLYNSALMCDLDAVGSSDVLYGSSSGKAKYWERPDVEQLYFGPIVKDEKTGKIYRHQNVKVAMDFSNGESSAEKY